MHHRTLAYAAVLSFAAGIHGAHLPTFMTDRVVKVEGPQLRYRAAAGPDAASAIEKRDFPLTKDDRCGVDYGTRCPDHQCCSSAGWCGSGYLYCSGPSCQFEYGPQCDANVRPDGPDTEDTPRPHLGGVPYGKGIYHCEKKGVIALTFDDGPYAYTKDLLDMLKRYGAKATFFITGRNLGKGAINDPNLQWRSLIKRMIDEGHQVASHTWTHQRLTLLGKADFHRQMIFNEIALSDILGYFPTYMRPPYSASNGETDAWLGDLGYHVTYFNLDTEGYLHDNANTVQLSKDIWDERVEGADPSKTQFLQIEHDPVYQTVYNLTLHILPSLFANGFKSVTVGECLNDPQENWYRRPDGDRTTTTKRSTTETKTAQPTSTLPASKDGRCGPGFGDATCIYEPIDKCCSQRGWCGATTDHCGTGCQAKYGTCGTKPVPTLPATKDGRCGPGYGDATCAFEPTDKCCSQRGWCGATSDHCGTGCQSGYGNCN